MRQKTNQITQGLLGLLTACLILAGLSERAHADIFSLWVKPKVDYINGTGDVFKRFEGSPAYGVEAGVELLSISLWGDYELVGQDQYWASGNIGYDLDLSFGDWTLMAGGYAGLIFFGFPEAEESSGNDLDAIPADLKMKLGSQYDEFVDTYNTFQSAEKSTSNMAYGANLRARVSLEYTVLPFISLGVQGMMGWHTVISGEEAASGFKAKAIESFVDDNEDELMGQGAAVKKELKTALGAEDIDPNKLKGVHYTAGAFLNVKF